MNTFALDIWNDEATKCTFYSVKWDGEDENETDKFLLKYYSDPKYVTPIKRLRYFIEESIGEDHGPVDVFFNRNENEVKGFPPKGEVRVDEIDYLFIKFPLRLYALKISEEIVILFNGGIKDGATNQLSSLHNQWVEACQFAKKIIQAFREGTIVIDESGRYLVDCNGSNEIVL
ncbi:MAG: hypothetical protein U0W65_14805 [Bacteroidia bacterium]